MEVEVRSGGETLATYVAEPPVSEPRPPVVIVCHGYPSGALRS